MSLSKKVFSLASFSVLDTFLLKAIFFVSTLIAYRLLDVEAVGLIGISAGYMVIVTFLAITPESILVRDFKRIKPQLDEHLSAYVWFWFYRSLVLSVVALLLCGLLYVLYSRVDLVVFFFLNHLAFQAGLFAGIFKEAFFAEFRQKLITVVNLALAVVQLIFVLALFWWANIYLYGAAILAAGMLTALVWWIIAKKKLHFRFVPRVEWKKISFASLKDFALWTHLTSAANRATYQFDVVILSLFVSLKLVAAYTIALTVANLFLLFPQVLQRAAILGIANLESKESIGETTGIFLKYFFLLSLAEFIFFYWFGNLIVGLYHPEDLSLVFGLSLTLLFAMIFLNTVRPLGAVIFSKLSLKDAFFRVSLPVMIFSLLAYAVGGVTMGLWGVAYANIPAYLFSALATIWFCRHRLKELRFDFISPIEKKFWSQRFR